jgi:hypothetical protein
MHPALVSVRGEITMSDITQEMSAAAAHSIPQAKSFIHRIWPQAIVGIALTATTVWTCLLVYGFVRLVLVLI